MRAGRAGFTLIELLVAIVMGGIMATAVYRTVLAQHVVHRHHNAVAVSQQATRAALEVLATELREISATDGDVAYANTHRLDFRAFRKFGIVCGRNQNEMRLDVWVMGATFERGDSVVAYAQRTAAEGGDQWRRMIVDNLGGSPSCDPWSGRPVQRIRLTDIDAAKLTHILNGAPVRGFVNVSYRLAHIDGRWVLARQAGDNPDPVPMLGPLLPPASQGLVFRYFNATGAELVPGPGGVAAPGQIARIEIAAAASAPGAHGSYQDSLVTQVHLRGNTR